VSGYFFEMNYYRLLLDSYKFIGRVHILNNRCNERRQITYDPPNQIIKSLEMYKTKNL
jgi:hypothetical protein